MEIFWAPKWDNRATDIDIDIDLDIDMDINMDIDMGIDMNIVNMGDEWVLLFPPEVAGEDGHVKGAFDEEHVEHADVEMEDNFDDDVEDRVGVVVDEKNEAGQVGNVYDRVEDEIDDEVVVVPLFQLNSDDEFVEVLV